LVDSLIRSEHRGKGQFTFFHLDTYERIYLEFIAMPSEQIVKRDVFLNRFFYYYTADTTTSKPILYNQNNEVTFSVLNPNKVVEPYGSKRAGIVTIRFQTNELVDPNDRYVVQLKFKEEILGQQELRLIKSMRNFTLDVKANRTMINGGLITVNLYKLSQSFI
jgi:hypothetical protein